MLMILADGMMAMTTTVLAKLNLMAVTAARRLIYNYFIGTFFLQLKMNTNLKHDYVILMSTKKLLFDSALM